MKTPFYMTYPMQNLYQTEMEYEKDMERMRELYPKEVRKILLCVEDRCDELEFEGSRIFDENPDRLMMEREVLALYQKLLREGMAEDMPVPNGGQMPEERRMPEMGQMPEMEKMPEETRMPEMGQMPESSGSSMTTQTCCKQFSLYPPEGWELPEEKELESMSPPQDNWRRRPGGARGPERRPGTQCNGWLCNMVGVLFQDEVYRRRCRYRRCHRWW